MTMMTSLGVNLHLAGSFLDSAMSCLWHWFKLKVDTPGVELHDQLQRAVQYMSD